MTDSPAGGGARTPLLGLLLAALVTVAYLPVRDAGWVWDDDDYVTESEVLSEPGGLARIWRDPSATAQYYPLVHTSFWMEHRLWGEAPRGYHLVNVALHILGALLLWRILARLRVPGAWVAAAVFGLHPVHVESVAWVTERKNVLSGVLYFASAGSWLRWRFPDAGDRGPRLFYGLAVLLFALALLAKTSTVTLPFALLLVVWWKRGTLRLRDGVAVLPLLALSVSAGLLTVWVETHHVGAQGGEWTLSPVQRLVVAGRALWFYAGTLVLPVDLAIIHPRWRPESAGMAALLFPAGALAVIGVLAALRNRWGRAPLTAVLFFAGTLAPVLGFFNVYFFRYSFVADHFQYLPSVGLIALATAGAVRALERAPRVVPVGVTAAVFLALGTLTWRQASTYHDAETLWRHTLRINPDAWMAHNNLGLLLQEQGKDDEARDHFDAAIRVAPDVAEPYNNRGLLRLARGDTEAAVRDFGASLERDPEHVQVYLNRAVALASLGRHEDALRDCATAISKAPASALPYFNRAAIYREAGDPERALLDYDKAIELSPDWANAYKGRADALYLLGRAEKAAREYARALALDPRLPGARNGRAAALLQLGDVRGAATELEQCREYGGTPSPRLVAAIRSMLGR